MKRIIIGLLLLTGLSGCHIYRTYERPELSGVDSLYRVPAMTEDTMSLADRGKNFLPIRFYNSLSKKE